MTIIGILGAIFYLIAGFIGLSYYIYGINLYLDINLDINKRKKTKISYRKAKFLSPFIYLKKGNLKDDNIEVFDIILKETVWAYIICTLYLASLIINLIFNNSGLASLFFLINIFSLSGYAIAIGIMYEKEKKKFLKVK